MLAMYMNGHPIGDDPEYGDDAESGAQTTTDIEALQSEQDVVPRTDPSGGVAPSSPSPSPAATTSRPWYQGPGAIAGIGLGVGAIAIGLWVALSK